MFLTIIHIFSLYFVSLPNHLIQGTICCRTPEHEEKCDQFNKVIVGLVLSQYEVNLDKDSFN